MTRSTEADPAGPRLKPATHLVVGGRDPSANHGFVNPPVHHVSTVLYPTRRGLSRPPRTATSTDGAARRPRRRWRPRSRELEGPACAGVALLPSGLAAITTALLSVARCRRPRPGHRQRLSADPQVLRRLLARYGIATTYYDPMIGAGIAALIRPNTRAVFVEAPGSLSFEVQDVPAIAAAAHARGAMVLMDNTWATPLYFRAFDKGVDLSIQAAHQIYRRPFRRDARHGVGQRRDLAAPA